MSKLLKDQLYRVKRELIKSSSITLKLPPRFSFRDHGIFEFAGILDFFNWSHENVQVKIDMSTCSQPNYQTLALLVLYAWKLKDQGCTVSFLDFDYGDGAGSMWRKMGGRGTMNVLFENGVNFKSNEFKPLFAVRDPNDFKNVIKSFENFTKDFNVEYINTLRYVLSELLYNTLEHGQISGGENINYRRIPSLAQFTWYQKANQIHFIIADIGVGIKKHIEQAFPSQESDEDAIRLAIKPKVSGTFGRSDPYKEQNNAGMGLYLSTNIIKRLNANMHILSGNGLLHISPRDITSKTLSSYWPGTIAFVTVEIDNNIPFHLQSIMQEFRSAANEEQKLADSIDDNEQYYISINDFFGSYAEDKTAAIKLRDTRIFKALDDGKMIILDFKNVISSPHSFLSALIASPIKSLGLKAYKKLKFINTAPEIRETIDFILDDNTE